MNWKRAELEIGPQPIHLPAVASRSRVPSGELLELALQEAAKPDRRAAGRKPFAVALEALVLRLLLHVCRPFTPWLAEPPRFPWRRADSTLAAARHWSIPQTFAKSPGSFIGGRTPHRVLANTGDCA